MPSINPLGAMDAYVRIYVYAFAHRRSETTVLKDALVKDPHVAYAERSNFQHPKN